MTMILTEVSNTINECKNIKTIIFNMSYSAMPGQFVMVWLPEVDEVPMSLSYIGEMIGITVEDVGKATSAMHSLGKGDRIGIRGPLGNGFRITGPKILVIGGGSGVAPLGPLVDQAMEQGYAVTAALGARSEREILFSDRLAKTGAQVRLASDDGSVGFHGYVSEVAGELLDTHEYDQVFACGPELMLVKCVDLAKAKGIPIQVSMERHMKCGIGICGSCQLGGFTVCRDGPVFDGETLAHVDDFGSFKRSPSGKKVDL
jgi:dihydroorotate dehydrogenase electron transfer subunit